MTFALPEIPSEGDFAVFMSSLRAHRVDKELLRKIEEMCEEFCDEEPTSESIKLEDRLHRVRLEVIRQNSNRLADILNTTWS